MNRRRQVQELRDRNAWLEKENKALRKALDTEQREKAEWQRRADRHANDAANAKTHAIREVLGDGVADEIADLKRRLANKNREIAGLSKQLDDALGYTAEDIAAIDIRPRLVKAVAR